MPRLPQKLLLRAHSISPLLPLLLRITRELPSATNELRWFREHIKKTKTCRPSHKCQSLLSLCKRRERGEPLQYILGTQPFGELEIKCRPGVLIPRPETEAYTMHLAKLLNEDRLHEFITKDHKLPSPVKGKRIQIPPDKPTLKILDLCSGSGCISLLLHSQVTKKFPNLSIRGWDISKEAISLAEENLNHNLKNSVLGHKALNQLQFHQLNIFKRPESVYSQLEGVDIIISNPPYISGKQFVTETTRSVRNWEPRLALVPAPQRIVFRKHNTPIELKSSVKTEDIFYNELIHLHSRRNTCKVLLMEVGDAEQAMRVAAMALSRPHVAKHNRVEIWRDWPDQKPDNAGEGEVQFEGSKVRVIGTGKMRAVVLFLDQATPAWKAQKQPSRTRDMKIRKERERREFGRLGLLEIKDREPPRPTRGPGTFGSTGFKAKETR